MARPTKLTKECIQKLEDAYLMGATNLQASIIAGISESLLYEYKKDHPGFVEKIEQLKGMTSLRAKLNLKEAIEDGDKHDSKWWLERKDKDFKNVSKQEVEIGAHKSLVDAILAAKGK